MYTLKLYAFILDTFGSHHSISVLGISESDTHSCIQETTLHDTFKLWARKNSIDSQLTKTEVSSEIVSFFSSVLKNFFRVTEEDCRRFNSDGVYKIRFKHQYIVALRGAIYSSPTDIKTTFDKLMTKLRSGERRENIQSDADINRNPVTKLICLHANNIRRQKERRTHLDMFDVSLMPFDNLSIHSSMRRIEKEKRANTWKKAFGSNKPPEVSEIHREYMNFADTINLVDVSLRLHNGDVIRVEELPASILPNSKRNRNN